MARNGSTLFGRFVGQSMLKQGEQQIRLTPDGNTESPSGTLGVLPEAVELEGTFGIVSGELDGRTLFGASIEEVVPPIMSGVLDRLLKDGTIKAEAMLPEVHRSLKSLVGEPATPSTRGKPLCALVVGHRKSRKGAASRDGSVNEFDFNSALAEDIKKRVTKARVEIVFRDNTTSGRKKLPAKINALGPHFTVSLHCNASDSNAGGTETLYFKGSTKGEKLARIVQKRLLAGLGLRNRKIRSRTVGDRGGQLLKYTAAPCVIAEPFFISNDDDLSTALRRRKSLAAAYANAIDDAAAVLGG